MKIKVPMEKLIKKNDYKTLATFVSAPNQILASAYQKVEK